MILNLHYGEHVLPIEVVDHPIAHSWVYFVLGYHDHPKIELDQNWQRLNTSYVRDSIKKMNGLSKPLYECFGSFFDDNFYDVMKQEYLTRHDLNYLHDGYERIQYHLKNVRKKRITPTERDNAHKLNDYVHEIEMFLYKDTIKDSISSRPRFKCRFVDSRTNESSYIKSVFTSGSEVLFKPKCAGEVYMSYAQVGKSPLTVYKDRDTVTPIEWKKFGPAFWFALEGHDESADFDEARQWLNDKFGEKDWLLGEPKVGDIVGSLEDHLEQIRKSPVLSNITLS